MSQHQTNDSVGRGHEAGRNATGGASQEFEDGQKHASGKTEEKLGDTREDVKHPHDADNEAAR